MIYTLFCQRIRNWLSQIHKSLLIAVFLSSMALIMIVNIRGSFEAYYGFYERESELRENHLYQSLSFIQSNDWVRGGLVYSGMETGYGFFAPNVASDFIVHFSVYNDTDSLLESRDFIPMNTKEGMVRIASAYTMFLEYRDSDSASINIKKCDIFLKGLSLQILKSRRKEACYVETTLYLYHHPTLADLNVDPMTKPKFFPIKFVKYTINDLWQ